MLISVQNIISRIFLLFRLSLLQLRVLFLFQKTKSPDCAPLPSIVICPPTITGHWVYEVEKFLSRDYLNPLQYIGPPAEREK